MNDNDSPARIDFKKLTITAVVFGFFLIPIHELGHVICDWITGHPAAMSYARDRLLSGGETPFLGLLGGPSLPIIVAAVAVVLIYRGKNLSLFYPVAIQASIERLVFYSRGILPSDERSLARIAGWNPYAFRNFFFALEALLLSLVIISFFKHRLGVKQSVVVVVMALVCFVATAALGVFIVERFAFPEQFKLQFG
ncbi:MAG: hypothetical protein ABSA83_23840 [Verrucomicrobiota bacterium]|jgi:hypothetical protein